MSKQLDDKALLIRDETVDAANTARRVGAFLLDFLQTALLPYDPAKAYAAGQHVVWRGQIVRALQAAPVNKTPDDAAYWAGETAEAAEITPTAPNRLVGSKALAEHLAQRLNDLEFEAVTVPVADETTAGKVRRASPERLSNEQEPGHATDYVTPEQVLALLGTMTETDIEQVLQRGNLAETLFVANGGVAADKWLDATGAIKQVFVPQYVTGKGFLLALADVDALTTGNRPALALGTLPELSTTVGVDFNFTLPADTVTDPNPTDKKTILYEADGPLPTGFGFDGPTRTATGRAAAAGNLTFKFRAYTSDGREKKFTLTVPVRAAGETVSIDRVYAGVNQDGSLSVFSWGNVPTGGTMRGVLEGINVPYGNNGGFVRDADRAGHSRPPFFTEKAPFAFLWGQQFGGDFRPPRRSTANGQNVPAQYTLTIQVVNNAGTTVLEEEIILQYNDEGIERQVFPAGTTVNLPPRYLNNFPARFELEDGKPFTGNVRDYVTDPEGDSLTFFLMAGATASGTHDTATGAFTITAPTDGTTKKIGFGGMDNSARSASTGLVDVVRKVNAFTIDRVDYKNEQYTAGGQSMIRHYFRFKLSGVPAGATLKLDRNNNLNQRAVSDLIAQTSSWYTHDGFIVDEYRSGNSTANDWTWKLLVNADGYVVYTTRYAGPALISDWVTILNNTGTGGGGNTSDTLTQTRIYMGRPDANFSQYQVTTDAAGNTDVIDLVQNGYGGHLRRFFMDGIRQGRGALSPVTVPRRGGLFLAETKRWANTSFETWNGSSHDPVEVHIAVLAVPGPQHSPNTKPAPAALNPHRTDWNEALLAFEPMAPIANKIKAVYPRKNAHTAQQYFERGVTHIAAQQFWADFNAAMAQPGKRHNTVGHYYSERHETTFAAELFQTIANYVNDHIGGQGMVWLDFEHSGMWGGEFEYGPQGTWRNMYLMFLCMRWYGQAAGLTNQTLGNMYQVGYWSNSFNGKQNGGFVAPLDAEFINAYFNNPFSNKSWGRFDFPGATVNLGGNSVTFPAQSNVSVADAMNAWYINGYLPPWQDEHDRRQFAQYTPYSLIHDCLVTKKHYPANKAIFYNWTQTDKQMPGWIWLDTPDGKIGYITFPSIAAWMAQYVEASGFLFGDGNYWWHDDQPFGTDPSNPSGGANFVANRQWIPNVPGTPAPWDRPGTKYPRIPQTAVDDALAVQRQLKDCENIWNTSQSARSIPAYSRDGGATWIDDLTPPTTANNDELYRFNQLTTPQKREINILVKAQDRLPIVYLWSHPTAGWLIYAHHPFAGLGETTLQVRVSSTITKTIKLLGAYPSIIPINPDGSFKYN